MLPSAADLKYFIEVATELHFSHAAKKLNTSQPSLSLAIKRLEGSLGVCLFIRHKQGVTLTRAGNELYKDVQKLLNQWEITVSNIKQANQCVKGQVTIGCHSTLAPFMSTMVSSLLGQYPGLEIHFQYELSGKIMENVAKGFLDIGLATDPYPHSDVVLQQVAYTEFTFWVSKYQSTLDLYAEDTVIICDPQLPQTQYLIKQLVKTTNHKQLRLNTMNQIETMAAMTAEGYGIGILPSSFTGRYFADKLQQVPNAPFYKKPLCLAYRPENKNVMAVQVVLDAIKALIQTESDSRNKDECL